MNAIQQVTAREGRPIIICNKGDEETAKFASTVLEVWNFSFPFYIHISFFIVYYSIIIFFKQFY